MAKHLDINTSRHAHPVEKLLDVALDVVPMLIAEAIDEVSQAPWRRQGV
ncbi:hypothetical protein [Actinospica sp.]|nr:hypothetical protein [Actinospica sp.]HWG25229.1 hypothetical protein [Actinospica sp.]